MSRCGGEARGIGAIMVVLRIFKKQGGDIDGLGRHD